MVLCNNFLQPKKVMNKHWHIYLIWLLDTQHDWTPVTTARKNCKILKTK